MNQQQLDALTIDQLWDAVCLATKECKSPHHWGPKGRPLLCMECSEGKGPKPGLVWALPGMQEQCPCLKAFSVFDPICTKCLPIGGFSKKVRNHTTECLSCHGTGYVAKRDLGALLEAALTMGEYISLEAVDDGERGWSACVGPNDYHSSSTAEQALLRAVAQALVAEGAELGATYDR